MNSVQMVKPDMKSGTDLKHLSERANNLAREKWLFENKAALKHVRQGLKDAAEGKLKKHGSFSKYVNK